MGNQLNAGLAHQPTWSPINDGMDSSSFLIFFMAPFNVPAQAKGILIMDTTRPHPFEYFSNIKNKQARYVYFL